MTEMPRRAVTVLHLEDEPYDVRLIRSHLASEGFDCCIVHVDREATFKEAIAGGGFDVILADHSLPDFDGMAALAIARQACPDVPFICVSGALGEELAIEALKSGATDYVLKHGLTRLGPALRRALDESAERTRRREAEAEVCTLGAQLRHSQRLEAIGQLAGGIAHDFNNLLTVINGYCERVLASVDETHPHRTDLDLIHRAGQRAAGLTRQLLAFSRRQVLQPKIIDLNVIVTDMAKILSRVIGERIELVSDLAPALWHTRADPGQIEQVIMNLAINARDAMPDGGSVTVTTANLTVAQGETHAELAPGDYVSLAISDTGHGMDADTAARVFEPFFTTKDAGKGTGLGLSTVYGIVTQSGGQITIESAPDAGTSMRVFLPRVQAVAPSAAAPSRTEPIARGTETLLLVEDEEFVRELVEDFLRSAGYTVIGVSTAEEALALTADKAAPCIDLLVTDVVLPGMSGTELADRLRRQMPGIEALYMSGYPGDAAFSGDIFDPGPAFLAKPFTRHVLTNKVRSILDGRQPRAATVCVVESNEDIRRLLAQMLEGAGYIVAERADLPTAGADVRHLDCALIDSAIVEHAGFAAIEDLARRHPGAQIVLMAPAFDAALLKGAAAAGVRTMLQKPVNEVSVLGTVARALVDRYAPNKGVTIGQL